ncbi:MAG: phosphotransferase [Candidatus Dormibacteria bacterium]
MTGTWTKTYPTATQAEAAAAHYYWIRDVGQLQTPDLVRRDDHKLVFAHVSGRHAAPADLPNLAAALARFHTAAYQHLAGARMNQPHRAARGLILPGFSDCREQRLLDLLAAPTPPDTPLTGDDVRAWIRYADDLPPAVYKDANIRNFLITVEHAPIAVDFDTLTLAPLGYDLAKLIVSAAMTYGPLDHGLVDDALTRYNALLADAALPGCTTAQFSVWTEMHHVLTSHYLGRNGYRFSWAITRR